MTKGRRRNSGRRNREGDDLLSDRELSRYLHEQWGFAPANSNELARIHNALKLAVKRAKRGQRSPKPKDLVSMAPSIRYGVEERPGSLASNIALLARKIYLDPCLVASKFFDWGHCNKARSDAVRRVHRVFLWTSLLCVPPDLSVRRTNQTKTKVRLCREAAAYVDQEVLGKPTAKRYSVPMDIFRGLLGRAESKRKRKYVWPDGSWVETGQLDDVPKGRPCLRLDHARELATFFQDEPLCQQWTADTWTLIAPQRAAVCRVVNRG